MKPIRTLKQLFQLAEQRRAVLCPAIAPRHIPAAWLANMSAVHVSRLIESGQVVYYKRKQPMTVRQRIERKYNISYYRDIRGWSAYSHTLILGTEYTPTKIEAYHILRTLIKDNDPTFND